jgi:hypothetical protein
MIEQPVSRIETLEALVEDLRLRVAHITPQCRICHAVMWLASDGTWICPANIDHPTLADWSCQS